jgi:phospholipid/cholesterol/gamma-HCH transport system permease protein
MARVLTLVESLGDATLKFLRYFGGLGLLTADAIRHTVTGPFRGRPVRAKEVWSQMVRVGPRALPVVFLVNFFIGMILALIGGNILQTLGFTQYVGNLLTVGIVLELGPLLTAIIMTGFIGAALASELGTMVVAEEVTALRTSGLHPVRFLVAPRMLAVFVMIPCVTVLGDFVGMIGGLVISQSVLGISANTYWEQGWDQLTPKNVWQGLLKTGVFAIIIGAIGCYQGFQVKGGAEGVGRATTMAVVSSIIMIIVADAILDYILLFLLD